MSTLTTSSRPVQGSLKANLDRRPVKQPAPPQASTARRPSFLLVLLRALSGVAA